MLPVPCPKLTLTLTHPTTNTKLTPQGFLLLSEQMPISSKKEGTPLFLTFGTVDKKMGYEWKEWGPLELGSKFCQF